MKNLKIKKTVPVIIYIIINVSTSSISPRNQVSDKLVQCSRTSILKNASTQCNILKKMAQVSAISIPAILQGKQRLRKDLHRKKGSHSVLEKEI
ncbi:hypothetical protein Avbf_13120 [Armadillidium vulgare]|nr:hypothetical protein Avbf_13120 [Armadillidium vulgare]